MSEERPNPATGARWLFVIAGFAALAVTLIRAVLGGQGDLPLMTQGLDRPEIAAVTLINWHALTATFATLAIGLLLSARLHRAAAQAIGMIAALIFGATAILFMIMSWRTMGTPFAFYPFIPLGLVALLSALAAWRA